MPIQKKRGVIVFLDALGVSKYTHIDQFISLIEQLENFKDRTNYVWNEWKLKFKSEGIILPDPEIAFFQDSLIVCFPEPEKDAEGTLHNFFSVQNWLMQAIVLATEKQLFFRGAISNGEYIFTESKRSISILGGPVVEASKFEKCGDWIGVIQTPAFQQDYLAALTNYSKIDGITLEESIRFHRRFWVEYDVPINRENRGICNNDGTNVFFVANWPTLTKNTGTIEIRSALIEGMKSADRRNKAKYRNTLAFLDFCEQNRYFIE